MKKKITAMLLSAFLTMVFSGKAWAGETEGGGQGIDLESKETYDTLYEIEGLDSLTYDEEGRLLLPEFQLMSWAISGSVIEAGHTKYYWPSGQPQGFYLQSGKKLKVTLKLSEPSVVTVGLTNGDFRTIEGMDFSIYLYAHSTGFGKVYISNLGNTDITVRGTIETDTV